MTHEVEKKQIKGCLKFLFGAAFSLFALVFFWFWSSYRSAPPLGKALFTPNEAANFITEPLDENGDVDYVEYINRDSASGVTRDNNAVVKLVEALGAQRDFEQLPDEFYQRLNIERPTNPDDAFVEFEAWFKSSSFHHERVRDDFMVRYDSEPESLMFEFGLDNPIDAEKLPALAAYVESQSRSLELAHQAAARTRYYYPKIPSSSDDFILNALLPHLFSTRDLARGLILRSNLRLGRGDIDGAIDDAMATVRLGQQIGYADTLVELLVSIAIRNIGYQQLLATASQADVTLSQLQKIKQFSESIETLDVLEGIVSQRERLVALDATQKIFRGGVNADIFGGMNQIDSFASIIAICDAESAMKSINELFDKALEIYKRGKTDESFDFETEFHSLMTSQETEVASISRNAMLLLSSRKARGRQLAKLFGSLLMPAIFSVEQAQNRSNSELEMLRLSVALEIFRKTNGRYPEKLTQLVPDLIKKIPTDPLSHGKDFVYTLKDDRYRLYSIGHDKFDDGGPDKVAATSEFFAVDQDWWLDVEPPVNWEEFLKQRRTNNFDAPDSILGDEKFEPIDEQEFEPID